MAHPQAGTLPPLPAIAERISGSKYILENNPLNLEALRVPVFLCAIIRRISLHKGLFDKEMIYEDK